MVDWNGLSQPVPGGGLEMSSKRQPGGLREHRASSPAAGFWGETSPCMKGLDEESCHDFAD